MAEKREDVAVWFEIPAANFERAVGFYEKLVGYTLMRENMGAQMAVFKHDQGCVSGCLREKAGHKIQNQTVPADGEIVSGCVMEKPGHKGTEGVMIYLNVDGFLDEAVGRVEKAGGKLCSPIVQLPGDMGRFIHIEDTEGNRVGLHAVV